MVLFDFFFLWKKNIVNIAKEWLQIIVVECCCSDVELYYLLQLCKDIFEVICKYV